MDEVTLNPLAAFSCIQACKSYITGVNELLIAAQKARREGGFGNLESGKALGQKFAGLAVGEHYSLDTVLRQHIDVIEKLKTAFETAAKRYVETDRANAAKLNAQQPDS